MEIHGRGRHLTGTPEIGNMNGSFVVVFVPLKIYSIFVAGLETLAEFRDFAEESLQFCINFLSIIIFFMII